MENQATKNNNLRDDHSEKDILECFLQFYENNKNRPLQMFRSLNDIGVEMDSWHNPTNLQNIFVRFNFIKLFKLFTGLRAETS